MKLDKLTTVFDALSQETRLKVFRILVENSKDGICPCEIAEKLKIPRNTLSFHLSLLSQANLCQQTRKGKMFFYKPNCDAVKKAAAFLLKNCCEGECKC